MSDDFNFNVFVILLMGQPKYGPTFSNNCLTCHPVAPSRSESGSESGFGLGRRPLVLVSLEAILVRMRGPPHQEGNGRSEIQDPRRNLSYLSRSPTVT